MIKEIYRVLADSLYAEQERYILWAPVLLSIGILIGFSTSMPVHYGWLFIGSSIFIGLHRITPLLSKALLFVIFGIGIVTFYDYCQQDFELVRTPQYLKAFQGKVMGVEQTNYGRKITINEIQSDKPFIKQKVQLLLRGCPEVALTPGDIITGTAKLLPIREKLIPSGFDFKRKAQFDQVQSGGFFLRCPVIQKSYQSTFSSYRYHLTQFIFRHLSAPVNAVVAALITGESHQINTKVREQFAASGLAHVLAISGLHMNLIGGAFFFLVILFLNLVPYTAHHWPVRKIAGFLTIGVGVCYLFLSGAHVSTQRAFLMLFFVMVALIFDRHPLSMRLVAIAAVLILIWRPDYLFAPSFQLSFAAVTALISSYESRPNFLYQIDNSSAVMRFFHYFIMILYSSLIATAATLPFTLYHFHYISVAGILANLIAIPLTAFLIMPLVLFVLLSYPIDLALQPLTFLSYPVDWLIKVAAYFSNIPGSRVWLPPLSPYGLCLIVIGGLWLCLWRERWRHAGWMLIMLGVLTLCGKHENRSALVSADGLDLAFIEKDTLCVMSRKTNKLQYKAWADYMGIAHPRIKQWCHCERVQCTKNEMVFTTPKGVVSVARIRTKNTHEKNRQIRMQVQQLRKVLSNSTDESLTSIDPED